MQNLIPVQNYKFYPDTEWKKKNLIHPKNHLDPLEAEFLREKLESHNSMVFQSIGDNKHYVIFADRIGYYLTEIPLDNEIKKLRCLIEKSKICNETAFSLSAQLKIEQKFQKELDQTIVSCKIILQDNAEITISHRSSDFNFDLEETLRNCISDIAEMYFDIQFDK